MSREQISIEEFRARLKAQGLQREHAAFKCPVCATVQSLASLIKAGDDPKTAETHVGFSCEGRFSNAGPWPGSKDKSPGAEARRAIRGCDWTLGGLLRLHNLEIIGEDGKPHPFFDIATADEAKALQAAIAESTPA